MRARRPRRMRLRRSKSKHETQNPVKHCRTALLEMMGSEESSEAEPTHSLLLSSLRYWEVERDLIEERIASRTDTKPLSSLR